MPKHFRLGALNKKYLRSLNKAKIGLFLGKGKIKHLYLIKCMHLL